MSTPQWVRLYLVAQTEGNMTMPDSVEGLLTGETAGSYILNPMLEENETEEFEKEYKQVGMNLINKTYVWRCQILKGEPEYDKIKISTGIGE